MKDSRFNYFIKYKDSNIMFNTLTSKFFLLDQTVVELYQAAIAHNEIDALKECHPTFFQKLVEGQFIIDDKEDETEKVRKIMHQIDNDDRNYYLIINPTMNCNFNCWYCYESHIKKSRMSEQTIQSIIAHLTNVVNQNKIIESVTLGWFGGEPLLHFNNIMLPIMRQAFQIAKENNLAFSENITTNGFLIKKEMIPYFQSYNLNSFQITLDGNRSLHDTVRYVSKNRGSYNDIISNIKLLVQNKLSVIIRVNYTKPTLDSIEEIYEDLRDLPVESLRYLEIVFHQVWQDENRNLNTIVRQKYEKKGVIF